MKIRKGNPTSIMDRDENRRSVTLSVLPIVTAIVLAWAGVASADWLVMKDGSQVETQGPWKVEDSRIVFEIEGGTLASLRSADIDLDASHRLTAAAEREAESRSRPAVPAPRKKATFVLTDDDVGHLRPEQPDEDAEATDSDDLAVPAGGEVAVASWNTADLPEGNGLRLVGSVRNSSANVAAGLSILIRAYDSTDELLLSAPAILGAQALRPGQSTSMAGELVGVFDYARVDFEVDYFPLESSAEAAPATSTQRPDEG